MLALALIFLFLYVVGKIVNKYRKHTDNEISSLAKRVYVKWKKHFQDHLDRPKIEVKCDAKTEKMRASGKRFLSDSLSVEVGTSYYLIYHTILEL